LSQLYHTPEQAEFSELMERIEAAGWRQADLARELNLSRPAISMYKKGTSNPSERTLSGMRGLVQRLEKAKQQGSEVERRTHQPDIASQLAYLRANDPAAYEAVKATVATLHQRAIDLRGVSLKVASVAIASQEVASALAQDEIRSRQRKRKAVSPTADKPAPKRDVDGH
jgi:transcriptional regulator with XRE-family HTH domain